MKKPFVYIVFALFLTLILVLYKHLGGFNEPLITFEPVRSYTFYGSHYRGEISGHRMEDLFTEMRDLKYKARYNGPLVMVWFDEPKTRNDSINVFIGIEILPAEPVPGHYDGLSIEMNGLIRAVMKGHASVLPVPSAIAEKIKDFAMTNNYQLQDILIDKYLSDSVVYTEIPVVLEAKR